MAKPKPTFVQRLTRDKRKLSMMLALCGVAMLLWGRLLLKEVPRTAVAEPDTVANASASDVADGTDDDTAARTPSLPRVSLILPQRPPRDPFDFDAEGYRIVPGSEFSATGVGDGGPPLSADLQSKLAAARELASELRLRSVVLGPEPRAVVNDRVVGLGDRVAGFTVRHIAERHVELQRQDVRVLLRM